jgi:hypothetical protein
VAVAVDLVGNVYVVGIPAPSFSATPGALQTSLPRSKDLVGAAYLLKISPGLDRVVYATLLCQGQCRPPTALTVDSQGDAYVGAAFLPVPDLPLFPAKQLGVPPPASGYGVSVLGVNAQGSALVWADGLGGDSVDSLVASKSGQVMALVSMIAQDNEALYTIGSGSGQVEAANFLGRVTLPAFPFMATGFLAAAPGITAPTRILVALNSGRIPAAINDQTATPVLVDFAEPLLQADLSVELTLLQPVLNLADIRATVTNHGPNDAEGVQVQVGIADPDNSGFQPIECLAGGAAVCSGGDFLHGHQWVGALIPKLPAGETKNIEFVEDYICPSPCTQWVNGTVFSLTSDPKLANNFVRLPTAPLTNAFDAALIPPQPGGLLPQRHLGQRYPRGRYTSNGRPFVEGVGTDSDLPGERLVFRFLERRQSRQSSYLRWFKRSPREPRSDEFPYRVALRGCSRVARSGSTAGPVATSSIRSAPSGV